MIYRILKELTKGKMKPIRVFLLKIQHLIMLSLHFYLFINVYKKSYKLCLLLLFIIFPHYLYNAYLKATRQNKKFTISFYSRIFCCIPYFQLIINLFSRGDIFIFTWLRKEVGLSFNVIANIRELMIPGVKEYIKIMDTSLEYCFYFDYFFNFYYVARNSSQFSYFTRYHYMYAFLLKSIMHTILSIVARWQATKKFPFFSNRITTDIILILYLFIGYGLIKLSFGKQPILPFFDQSIKYQIGRQKNKY